MRVALIHGFNVWDGGKATVDRFAPILKHEGHEPINEQFDYGWTGLVTVRLRSRKVVDDLLEVAPDAVICHSNGAAIVQQAINEGLRLNVAVMVQPALDKDARFGPTVGKIICLHNSGDWAVQLGQVWSIVNPVSWFKEHPWGAAGHGGFVTKDPRIENWDTDTGPHPVSGHSTLFGDQPAFMYWSRKIVRQLRAAEGR